MYSSAISMAKTSALELLSEGIPVRVNAVAPGTIKTNMLPKGVREMDSELSAGPSGEYATYYLSDQDIHNNVCIVIANAVLYLASGASYISSSVSTLPDYLPTRRVRLRERGNNCGR